MNPGFAGGASGVTPVLTRVVVVDFFGPLLTRGSIGILVAGLAVILAVYAVRAWKRSRVFRLRHALCHGTPLSPMSKVRVTLSERQAASSGELAS